MKRILISAVSTPVSVSYIKHLQDKGFFVVGMDIVPESAASVLCDEFHICPKVTDESNYISFLKQLDFDLFIPWLDEEHLLFAEKRELIEDLLNKIVTSPNESILNTVNKNNFYSFCQVNSIPTAQIKTAVPAFVKPIYGRGSKGASVVLDQEELNEFLKDENYIVQEILQGDEYTVDVLCDFQGKVIEIVPRLRISAVNVSLSGKVVLDDKMISFCQDLCQKFHFIGPINIQLFKNDKGDFKLVEINPRLAGTSILSIKAGFDLLVDSIEMFLDGKDEFVYQIKNHLVLHRYYNEIYR